MADETVAAAQEETKKLSKREEVAAVVAAEKQERVTRCGQRISEILKEENCAFNVAPKFVPVDDKGKFGISCEMILSAL
jgi:hypothetical protein